MLTVINYRLRSLSNQGKISDVWLLKTQGQCASFQALLFFLLFKSSLSIDELPVVLKAPCRSWFNSTLLHLTFHKSLEWCVIFCHYEDILLSVTLQVSSLCCSGRWSRLNSHWTLSFTATTPVMRLIAFLNSSVTFYNCVIAFRSDCVTAQHEWGHSPTFSSKLCQSTC